MAEHKTERRTREIGDTFCIEPGCDYYNMPAVQGHCYTVLDAVTDKYIEKIGKAAYKFLQEIKDIAGKDHIKYVEQLETYLVSMSMNNDSLLDQLVTLRRENARLKLAIDFLEKRTTTHKEKQ